MPDTDADIEWRDDQIPVSTRFDDPYYSLENGLNETRHVFLAGNDLPDRFCDGFRIAELVFGTGLNFLATVQCWKDAGAKGHLHYTSFEAFPMSPDAMEKALSHFPELDEISSDLITLWRSGDWQADLFGGVQLTVIDEDARLALPLWRGMADAWYLDGFSPAKNPELWGEQLMSDVARHTVPGGTAATYTAAGFVRRGLAAAGFAVERVPGFGRKRHMTRARLA